MQSRKETNLRGSCDSSRASLSAHAMSMHSGCQIMRWACVEYRSHAAGHNVLAEVMSSWPVMTYSNTQEMLS
eukprot:scaffold291556_cov19-Tisochrysis_lutea.AAC.1